MDMMKRNELGFVMVTALVLLSILTLVGIGSQYKTLIGIKVSKSLADFDRAGTAASAGLAEQYWYWSEDTAAGQAELEDVVIYALKGTTTMPSIYKGAKTPNAVDAGNVPTDAEIAAPGSGYKVYTFTGSTVVDNIAWGAASADRHAQTAVWATTFSAPGDPADFPYQTAVNITSSVTAASCSECRLVTYSLARFGEARVLNRETQSVIQRTLSGVSAMTNAPNGDDFTDICAGGNSSRTGAANAGAWDDPSSGKENAVIEVTQAPYLLGAVPSGVALASNTEIGGGGKGFRNGTASETGTTFQRTPLLIYSGHDTYSNVRIDLASVAMDTTYTQMPIPKLPSKLVNAPLLADQQIKYFSDSTEQLFEYDAYRWAAEQFVCQTPISPFPASPPYFVDSADGNGRYCTKADALRRSLKAMGYPAEAPVTGRLTIAQFQYNVANSIPMFGVVRLMFPAVADAGVTATCDGVSTQLHVIESTGDNSAIDIYGSATGWDFNTLAATSGGAYTGRMPALDLYGYAFAPSHEAGYFNAEPDDDGDLGSNARIILYGSFLIDYFADYDIESSGNAGYANNAVFDPYGGERILGILESPDVYLAIEHNILLNPTMPKFGVGAPLPFPTAAPTAKPAGSTLDLTASGKVNMHALPDGYTLNKVNLASPYDGVFPSAEGLLPVEGEGDAGVMRLMSRGTTGLVKLFGAASTPTVPTAKMTALLALTPFTGTLAEEHHVLHYYYDLMKKTASQNEPNNWPIAPWPGSTFAGNFCIGEEDCGTSDPASVSWSDHDGDLVHLMFPSGYMHGWKVALAALDLDADEWNSMLTGISSTSPAGLWKQIENNCDGTLCRMGRPFSIKDSGLYKSVALETRQSEYFHVTKDATTGYGLLDSDWVDIPAQMYSGGLLDMHAYSNMNGIIYTPGPLEWEPGNSSYDSGDTLGHLSYVTGAIITGYGAFTKNKTSTDGSSDGHRYALSYAPDSVDNIATSGMTVILRRYAWQKL